MFETTSELLGAHTAWAGLVAAALVALRAFASVRRGEAPSMGTYGWMAVFFAAAVLAALACALGMVRASAGAYAALCLAIAVSGLLIPLRELGFPHSGVRDGVVLCLAAPLAFLGMELACNPVLFSMVNTYAFVEVCLILALLALCYFLAQRTGWLAALAAAALVCFGVLESYVEQFKATAIMPSDLLAVRTAAAVAGGYRYEISGAHLAAACALVLCLFVLAFAGASDRAAGAHATSQPRRRLAVNLACAFGLAVCLAFATVPADYQESFGFKLYYWDLKRSYHRYGLLTGFLAAAQDLPVAAPAGYSDEEARALVRAYADRYDKTLGSSPEQRKADAQFGQVRPNVVFVLCETYSDLSIFEGLHAGYEGTRLFSLVPDALSRGWASVSVHGGGTCNSEFEILTGMSLGFLGQGKYPFLQYSFDSVQTLPESFAQLGYGTSGMHPAYAGNWNRDLVYPAMGFQHSFFFDGFRSARRFHGYISDGATYDKVLELLEDGKDPQFVFDMTLQNHSGHGLESIPVSQRTGYRPSDYGDAEDADELNEYLSCIEASDRDLEALLDALGRLERPTVLVFLGDHQPALSRGYNDAFFEGEDELAHAQRIMQVPYAIWANYEVAGRAQDGRAECDLGLNYLGAYLLQQIGAPLTDFQKAQLVLAQQLPAVNINGYADASGAWHFFEEGAGEGDPCRDLAFMQYLRYKDEF